MRNVCSVFLCLTALATHSAWAGPQREFTALLQAIEQDLDRDKALLSSGGGLKTIWLDDDAFLYFPDTGRLTVDRVDISAKSQRRLISHEDLQLALQNSDQSLKNCELAGFDSVREELTLVCSDDMYGVNGAKLTAVKYSDAGKTHRLLHEQLISDQFPTTFGPLMESASPDGRRFATVRDHNLYLRSAKDGELRALTSDGNLRETWRNTQESAQAFTAAWSADSRTLATLQLDTRKVWHEPLPQLLENPPRTEPVAYPRAGEPIHDFRLVFIDVKTGNKTWVKTGDTRDHYVDVIGWQGDDRGLLYQVLDREQKKLRVYRADRSDGSTRLLMEDVTETYHDSWMTLFIDFVHPLTESNGFLYLSEESGWRHIEHYDGEGRRLARVTKGKWAVERIVHVDEVQQQVYFLAAMSPQQPYDLQLYRTPLSGESDPQRISGGKGSVEVRVGPMGRYFVIRYSSPTLRPTTELRRADGALVSTLGRFDDSALQAAGFGGMETLLVPDLTGRWTQPVTVFRPFGFDPAQSYPVIEHIYGGMQAIHTRHQFYGFGRGRVDDVTRMLLRSGYVVVRVDAPGTPGRGREFQDHTYGSWPQAMIDNHVSAIRAAAKSRPWMDLGRVGVYGHSWGSYMAQRAMIDAPEFYRAAAAHNGGSDFYDQPTYIEPFMGLPENNPEGYAAASNLTRVENIQGAVLSFTAPFDVNSGFSPAFKLVDAMVNAQKDIELVVTPGSNHRMSCCNHPETLFKLAKIRRFFDREVKQVQPSVD